MADLELWELAAAREPGRCDIDIGASADDVILKAYAQIICGSAAEVQCEMVLQGAVAVVGTAPLELAADFILPGSVMVQALAVGEIQAAQVYDATIDGRFDRPSASATASYDINVWRGPAGYGDDAWRPADSAHESVDQLSVMAKKQHSITRSAWRQSAKLAASTEGITSTLQRLSAQGRVSWAQGYRLGEHLGYGFWLQLPKLPVEVTAYHMKGAAAGTDISLRYRTLARQRMALHAGWQQAIARARSLRQQRVIQGDDLVISMLSAFDKAVLPGHGRHDLPVTPDTPSHTNPVNLDLRYLRWVSTNIEFSPDDSKIIIPIRGYYIVINTAQIVRAAGGQDIPAASVSIEVDIDSTSWQFSATVPTVAIAESLEGEEVIITINGHDWRVIVDGWTDNRAFNQMSATISGRSLTAELSSSLALTRSFTSQSTATIQQLAQAELPEGWTLAWDAADWLVPAEVWSYQNQAPIDAIKTLAEAAGAFVVPGMAARTLSIIPRYKTAPWLNQVADIEIPEAIMLSMGRSRTRRTTTNGVWVTGGNAGVTAFVRRDGTAGNILADETTNALITDVVGARALGIRLLAGAMPSSMDTIELPLSSDTGLILPGTTISIPAGIGTGHGVKVSASRDSTNRLVVSQTLEVERILLEG